MHIKETLHHSDYAVHEERRSKIDPERIMSVEIGMKCPGCKTFFKSIDDETGPIEHGNSLECAECGLKMTLWGNALICERW
jgi:ferredoxin-like protein FixX